MGTKVHEMGKGSRTIREPLPSLTTAIYIIAISAVAILANVVHLLVGDFNWLAVVSLSLSGPSLVIYCFIYAGLLDERTKIRERNYRKVERYYSNLELPEPSPDILDELFPVRCDAQGNAIPWDDDIQKQRDREAMQHCSCRADAMECPMHGARNRAIRQKRIAAKAGKSNADSDGMMYRGL